MSKKYLNYSYAMNKSKDPLEYIKDRLSDHTIVWDNFIPNYYKQIEEKIGFVKFVEEFYKKMTWNGITEIKRLFREFSLSKETMVALSELAREYEDKEDSNKEYNLYMISNLPEYKRFSLNILHYVQNLTSESDFDPDERHHYHRSTFKDRFDMTKDELIQFYYDLIKEFSPENINPFIFSHMDSPDDRLELKSVLNEFKYDMKYDTPTKLKLLGELEYEDFIKVIENVDWSSRTRITNYATIDTKAFIYLIDNRDKIDELNLMDHINDNIDLDKLSIEQLKSVLKPYVISNYSSGIEQLEILIPRLSNENTIKELLKYVITDSSKIDCTYSGFTRISRDLLSREIKILDKDIIVALYKKIDGNNVYSPIRQQVSSLGFLNILDDDADIDDILLSISELNNVLNPSNYEKLSKLSRKLECSNDLFSALVSFEPTMNLINNSIILPTVEYNGSNMENVFKCIKVLDNARLTTLTDYLTELVKNNTEILSYEFLKRVYDTTTKDIRQFTRNISDYKDFGKVIMSMKDSLGVQDLSVIIDTLDIESQLEFINSDLSVLSEHSLKSTLRVLINKSKRDNLIKICKAIFSKPELFDDSGNVLSLIVDTHPNITNNEKAIFDDIDYDLDNNTHVNVVKGLIHSDYLFNKYFMKVEPSKVKPSDMISVKFNMGPRERKGYVRKANFNLIKLGCFAGTFDEAIKSINHKYSPGSDKANNYIKDVRECLQRSKRYFEKWGYGTLFESL